MIRLYPVSLRRTESHELTAILKPEILVSNPTDFYVHGIDTLGTLPLVRLASPVLDFVLDFKRTR
jgi:hypothetical protein